MVGKSQIIDIKLLNGTSCSWENWCVSSPVNTSLKWPGPGNDTCPTVTGRDLRDFPGWLHIWRFSKSWGYPQFSSILDGYFDVFSIDKHSSYRGICMESPIFWRSFASWSGMCGMHGSWVVSSGHFTSRKKTSPLYIVLDYHLEFNHVMIKIDHPQTKFLLIFCLALSKVYMYIYIYHL